MTERDRSLGLEGTGKVAGHQPTATKDGWGPAGAAPKIGPRTSATQGRTES